MYAPEGNLKKSCLGLLCDNLKEPGYYLHAQVSSGTAHSATLSMFGQQVRLLQSRHSNVSACVTVETLLQAAATSSTYWHVACLVCMHSDVTN